MRHVKSSNGFTLVELLVTLALLGIVISGGFTVYFFADRSFNSAGQAADVQANMQLAMLNIVEEVRLAHSLEVISNFSKSQPIPADDPDDVHYLFFEDGNVFLRTKLHNRPVLQSDDETTYSIAFGPVVGESGEPLDNMLRITLSSENPRVDYELESEIQILNLRTQGVQAAGPGGAIRFTKEISKEIVDPVGGRRCPYSTIAYTPSAPQLDKLRDFRDQYLARHMLGRFVVRTYYAIAPFVVSFAEREPLTREFAAALLRGLAETVIYLM
ncbi:PilW family protein [Candidatus Darwinibacter acetoxidans]|jgi:prepilin-type N-terminal cleavage/methylation domain-containing protein